MKKIILANLIGVLMLSCSKSATELSSLNSASIDSLVGQWQTGCRQTGVSSSIVLDLTMEKADSVTLHSRGAMSEYDQNNCTGNITKTDVNGQPYPVSGPGPVTDIATVQTLLPGMPSKYVLILNQALDSNGDPSGAPFYQVIYPLNNTIYILLVGSAVTGTTWDEWKTSSAVVTQFETDPEVSTDDGNETAIFKATKQ